MSQRTTSRSPSAKPRPAATTAGRATPPKNAVGRRWLFLGPPPHPFSLSGWALLPLRAFLGFTFVFAGLQKLANPNFFNANSPTSIQAQMIAAARVSPIHMLIGHLLRFSVPLGILIALGEIAVGLGTLLGLWTRIAAVGGAVLSFTLFLTVSFHASPYFTGADIVFFFAWMPLILAGSGGVLSLDGAIRSWAKHEARQPAPTVVPVEFAVIQEVCGNYDRGRCDARSGADCDPVGCPFLTSRSAPSVRRPDQIDRRVLVLGGAAVGATAVAALAGAGVAAGVGRAVGGAKSPSGSASVSLSPHGAAPGSTSTTNSPTTSQPTAQTSTPSTTPPSTTAPHPAGTALGPASDVPVGGAASFQDPASGDPGIVLRTAHDRFVAFDAVCPHAGCTVSYASGAGVIVCPCHGSEFNSQTGAVEAGPSPTGLRSIPIALGSDGQLYADG